MGIDREFQLAGSFEATNKSRGNGRIYGVKQRVEIVKRRVITSRWTRELETFPSKVVQDFRVVVGSYTRNEMLGFALRRFQPINLYEFKFLSRQPGTSETPSLIPSSLLLAAPRTTKNI